MDSPKVDSLKRPVNPLDCDSKDFAIEFAEYLAKAVENFQDAIQAELAGDHNQDFLSDCWRAVD